MSLKGIHIMFISASILLCVFFGIWAVRSFVAYQMTCYLATALGAFAAAAGLTVYAVQFVRKAWWVE